MNCYHAPSQAIREKGPACRQAGFTPFVIILGIVIVFGIISGAYFLGKTSSSNPKESTNIEVTPSPEASVEYSSSTLGFKLNLPAGWTVCDPGSTPGVIGLEPALVPSNECHGYTINTAYYNTFSVNSSVEVKRKPSESFINYVKRLDAEYMQQPQVLKSNKSKPKIEFISISPNEVLKKVTTKYPENVPVGTRWQALYIEDPQKGAIIIGSRYGSNSSIEDPNLQLIAANLTSIPIATGAVSGQVNEVSFSNDVQQNTPKPNFPITIYTDFTDKKTIAAATKSDDTAMFVVHLKPGTYYAKYPNGVWQPITVSLGKTTTFNPGLTPEGALSSSLPY